MVENRCFPPPKIRCESCGALMDGKDATRSIVELMEVAKLKRIADPAAWASSIGARCAKCPADGSEHALSPLENAKQRLKKRWRH
jgi:hypothetical protein